jgi:ribosomal protein S18 acetylase RimI-like enzyme
VLVRWLRGDECEKLAGLGALEGWIVAVDEIQKSQRRFPHLCFGAQVGDEFVGGLTSYLHEKSAWIGNFVVEKCHRGVGSGKALFESAMKALTSERSAIYLHAATSAVGFYESFGFRVTKDVVRLVYTPDPSCEHTKSFLPELSNDNFVSLTRLFDKRFFAEDRSDMLDDIQTKSSLVLSCPNGFCHSKIVDSAVCIGPWEMVSEAYLDAEKMLRTILSVRGQKTVYADVAADSNDAIALYKEYGFKEAGQTVQMCHGTPLALKYENIYAFASLGSKG